MLIKRKQEMDTNHFERVFTQLAHAYLQHLGNANLPSLLHLFAPEAEVLSPLYGRQKATGFYTALFTDTQQSELLLKDILTNAVNRSGCIFFQYSWTLASGEVVRFDVIDHLKLNDSGQITFLQIIYDTVQSRLAWEKRG